MKIHFIALAALCLYTSPLTAQTSSDSLRLSALRKSATERDPRAREIELLTEQSALRLKTIDADKLPAISTEAQAQHQSDVAKIPISFPGLSIPTPPYNTFDAHVDARQRLYDPSLAPRRGVERAQLAESQARVRTALYGLTETVNTAFFTALRSQSQIGELETSLTDIQAQLTVAEARVKNGTALPSEANTLRAELLRRRQSVAELKAGRRAALAVLSDLTGQPLDSNAVLATPDLSADAEATRASITSLRNRPEYEQFARTREVLESTDAVRSAQEKPRVAAFLRAGYGRPGLNALSDNFDTYWLGGVQFQWTPWNWGSTKRDRQVSALQREIVSAEERAFSEALQRSVEQDLAAIDRLSTAIRDDDQIIALRESVLAETRARFGEAVVTSAEYVDRQTDVVAARLSRATHRVELAQARAHLLTTLGIEVR
jgi:outer membrane protein TolC